MPMWAVGARSGLSGLTATILAFSSCGGAPNRAEGTRRLAGEYVLRDTRPESERNPACTGGTLQLNSDGTGIQRCTFRSGPAYEAPLTWKYDGTGNVYLSSFKDCSWVSPTDADRERRREKATHGASLVVDWAAKPGIIIHPDLNPSYDWVQPVSGK